MGSRAEREGAASSRTVLRLRDLGPLAIDVEAQGRVVGSTPVGGPKPARILSALLAHANSRVSRDDLVAVGWGDRAASEVAGPLESLIWRLRGVLEPDHRRGTPWTVLVNDRGGYRLVVDRERADSLRFAQVAEQGDALLAAGDTERAVERYATALALWRGRPFEAIADLEWAAASVAGLTELHAQVQEQYADALLKAGLADRAMVLLEEMTASSPLRERTWMLLMLARYRAGRTQEALATFGQVRRLLLDELGMEPGPLLRELHQGILSQDPALGPRPEAPRAVDEPSRRAEPVSMHLPVTLTPLVGREEEVSRLARVLGRHRLVTVVGAGGCGKTRLAIETARAAGEASPDGVWLVDLTPVESPAEAVYAIASALGVAASVTGDALGMLRGHLHDRRILLVLDNCEHLLPDLATLAVELLGVAGESRILATSREPLGIAGEVLWSLAPLPTRDTLGEGGPEAGPTPAARLFHLRAQSLEPQLDLAEDDPVVEAICAALDGLPLGIELAASRIRSFGPEEILTQITEGLADLSRVGADRPDHHDTIERSIDWSVRLLTAEERIAHSRLSVLPGVFTIDAATAVVGDDGVPPAAVPRLVSQLVHRSLLDVVRPDGPDRPTRYRQLVTVRAHAERALESSEGSAAARDRRAGFVAGLMADRPVADVADTGPWIFRVADNHDTVTAVLHQTLLTDPDPLGVRIMATTGIYWYFRNRMIEARRWMTLAVQQTDAAPLDRALAQLGLASVHSFTGRSDLAEPLVREALRCTDLDDRGLYLQMLVSVRWITLLHEGTGLEFVDDVLADLARSGDERARLYADLLTTRGATLVDGPRAVAPRAGELLDRALRLGSLYGAWLAGLIGVVCAILTKDVATGEHLMGQVDGFQRRMGSLPTASVLEHSGVLAVLAGDLDRGTRLLAQARQQAMRAGTSWPHLSASRQAIRELTGWEDLQLSRRIGTTRD
ncbi:putative Transcriptional regulator, winged helix family [Nostocoides japonicum T1-X7]|uniref:Putative Transcriptional regulator, winged helix family n=1 Tax=Nostocoides japonicum T1-X7 TaxID=1194083 RepID=A0A077LX49_9MICO|nr:BTAD domain-containing putative transcriptional regulator [Tetrasphaera japonica]CCH77462.1 putative Transcriptional regulator, winged helix family [Tetrasphaera japonica T1-X7]